MHSNSDRLTKSNQLISLPFRPIKRSIKIGMKRNSMKKSVVTGFIISLIAISFFISLLFLVLNHTIHVAKAQSGGCCIATGVCYDWDIGAEGECTGQRIGGDFYNTECINLIECEPGCCCSGDNSIGYLTNVSCSNNRFVFYPFGSAEECPEICSGSKGIVTGYVLLDNTGVDGASVVGGSESTTSSNGGVYSLALIPDTYVITASYSGSGTVCTGQGTVEVTAGETRYLNISLSCVSGEKFDVNGVVYYEDGSHVGEGFDVKAMLVGDDIKAQTQTNSSGQYTLNQLSAGNYYIISASGMSGDNQCSGSEQIFLDSNKQLNITVICQGQQCEANCVLISDCNQEPLNIKEWNCTYSNCSSEIINQPCVTTQCEQDSDCNDLGPDYVCLNNECFDCDADNDEHLNNSVPECSNLGTADDCNDHNPLIHPGAVEICDNIDNNCNNQIDEGCQPTTGCGNGRLENGEECEIGIPCAGDREGEICNQETCTCQEFTSEDCENYDYCVQECCDYPICNNSPICQPATACNIEISNINIEEIYENGNNHRLKPPRINVSWALNDECNAGINQQELRYWRVVAGSKADLHDVNLGSDIRDYEHEASYNSTYCYNITAFLDNGNKISDEKCLGDFTCSNTGIEYCYNNPESTCSEDRLGIIGCDGCYQKNYQACDSGYCFMLEEQPSCSEGANCQDCNSLVGMYAFLNIKVPYNNQNTPCNELSGICYLDKTRTVEDMYYNCSSVNSCYDYKTRYNCENDPCQYFFSIGGCEWVDISNELGVGVCKPKDASFQDCTECNNNSLCNEQLCSYYGDCYWDSDSNDLGDQFYDDLGLPYNVNTHSAGCINKEQVTCRLYDTEQDCENNQELIIDVSYSDGDRVAGSNNITQPSNDTKGIGLCRWIDHNNNKKCVKDSDNSTGFENSDDCFNSQNPKQCYYDFTPPTTVLDKPKPVLALTDIQNIGYEAVDDISGVENSWFGIRKFCYENITQCYESITYPSKSFELFKNILYNNASQYVSNNITATVVFYSEDNSSNLEVVKSQQISIDSKPPGIAITRFNITSFQVIEDVWVSNLTISFFVDESATCNAGLYQLYDGSWVLIPPRISDYKQEPYEYNVNYSNLGDGMYFYNISCEDNAGNIGYYTKSFTINADKTINDPRPRLVTINNSRVNISINTTNNALCRYSNYSIDTPNFEDMQAFNTEDGLFHYKELNLSSGFYHYMVACNFTGNEQGNNAGVIYGSRADDIAFAIDLKAPNTRVIDLETSDVYDNSSPREELSLKLECEDPSIVWGLNGMDYAFGCNKTKYCIAVDIDSCSWYNYNNDILELSMENYQGKTLYYYSIDKGGNIEDVASVGLNLRDTTAPELVLTLNGSTLSTSGIVVYGSPEPIINVETNEEAVITASITNINTGNTISYNIQPSGYNTSFNITTELLLDSDYYITVYATDVDGNTGIAQGFFRINISSFKIRVLQPHNGLMNISGEIPPGAGVDKNNNFNITIETEIPSACKMMGYDMFRDFDSLKQAFINAFISFETNDNLRHNKTYEAQIDGKYYDFAVICNSTTGKYSALEAFFGYDTTMPDFSFRIKNPNPLGEDNVIEDFYALSSTMFNVTSDDSVVCYSVFDGWESSTPGQNPENIAISNLEQDTKIWQGYKTSHQGITNAFSNLNYESLKNQEYQAVYNVTCENLAGLQSTKEFTITLALVDTPTIYDNTPDYFNSNPFINITTNIKSSCTLTQDNSEFATTNGYEHYHSLSDLDESNYSFEVECTSIASGKHTKTNISFTVDKTAPEVNITNITYYCNGQKVAISFASWDVGDYQSGISIIHYSLTSTNGEPIEGNTTNNQGTITISFTNLQQDTEYVVTLTAYDKAGNSNQDSKTFTAYLNTSSYCDTTPPTFNVLQHIDSVNKQRIVMVNCSDTGVPSSGCAGVTYYETNTTCDNDILNQKLKNGDYIESNTWPVTLQSFTNDTNICIAVFDTMKNINYSNKIEVPARFPIVSINITNQETLQATINITSDEAIRISKASLTYEGGLINLETNQEWQTLKQSHTITTPILYPNTIYNIIAIVNDSDSNYYNATKEFSVSGNIMNIYIRNPRFGDNQIPNTGFARQQSFDVVIETQYNGVCRWAKNCYGSLEECYNSGSQPFNQNYEDENSVKYPYVHVINDYNYATEEGELYYNLILCNETNTGILYAATFIVGFDNTNPNIIINASPNPVTDPASKKTVFSVNTDDYSICSFVADSAKSVPQNYGFNGFDYSHIESYPKNHETNITYPDVPLNSQETINYNVTCENLAGLQSSSNYVVEVTPNNELSITPVVKDYYGSTTVTIGALTDKRAECFIDNVPMETNDYYNHTATIEVQSEGTYTSTITCELLTVQSQASIDINYSVDLNDPEFLTDSITANCNLKQLRLRFKAIDFGSGIDYYHYQVYDESQLVFEDNISSNEGGQGDQLVDITLNMDLVEGHTYGLGVVAYDHAGHSSFASNSTIAYGEETPYCDVIPPNVSLLVNTNQEGVNIAVVCEDNVGCDGLYYYKESSLNKSCDYGLPLNDSWKHNELEQPLFYPLNTSAFRICVLAFDVNGNYNTSEAVIDPSMSINLIQPENGFAQQPVFNITVQTDKIVYCKHSKAMFSCELRDFNVSECFDSAIPFDETNSQIHKYYNFDAPSQGFEESTPYQWIVICKDEEDVIHYAPIILGYDTTAPNITVDANPDIVVDPSNIKTLLNITSDDYVSCEYAETHTQDSGMFEGGSIQGFGKQLQKVIDYSQEPYNINPGDNSIHNYHYIITCENLASFTVSKEIDTQVALDPEIHITIITPNVVTSTPVLLELITDKLAVCRYSNIKPLNEGVYHLMQSIDYDHYSWLDLQLDGFYEYNIQCESQYDTATVNASFILDTTLPEIVNATLS